MKKLIYLIAFLTCIGASAQWIDASNTTVVGLTEKNTDSIMSLDGEGKMGYVLYENLIPNFQQVTDVDSITNNKVTIKADSLNSRVFKLQVGNKILNADNTRANTRFYDEYTESINRVNLGISSLYNATEDAGGKVLRGLNVDVRSDLNGYEMTAGTAGATAIEGNVRLVGEGRINSATAGYFRNLIGHGTNAEITNAIGVLINSTSSVSGGYFKNISGLKVLEQSLVSGSGDNAENSANIEIGNHGHAGQWNNNYSGNYNILSYSEHPSYFTNKIQVDEAPTEPIDVLRLEDLDDYYTKTQVNDTLSNYTLSSLLSTVATSGSYNDLSDTPTIPEQVNLQEGANITITGTYPNLTLSASGDIGGSVEWGSITGTLSSQNDLQSALDDKYDASNPDGFTTNIGTVTSVGLQVPEGFEVSNSPITSSGAFEIDYAEGYQPYTTEEADKLASIEEGAEVNVNADWNASSGDAEILNKPTIPAQVNLIEGNNIDITGTYPDLTISAVTIPYKEDSFAGTIAGSISGTVNIGACNYVRIGNQVTVWVAKAFSTAGLEGEIRFLNLPYSAVEPVHVTVNHDDGDITLGSDNRVILSVSGSEAGFHFYPSATPVEGTDIAANVVFVFQLTYLTDDNF